MLTELEQKVTMQVRCNKKRCGNFIFGKVYEAKARRRYLDGHPADFYVVDEDGDHYTISEGRGKILKWWVQV